MLKIRNLVLVCAATSLLPAAARAQLTEPDSSRARLRLGPVMLNPTVELANLGVDTNVFNAPLGQEKSDFTFTLSPKSDLWMKVGRAWLTGNVREDVLWYQEYESERASNPSATVGIVAPLNRLAFGLNAGFANVQDRPGYEIDARAKRHERQLSGKAEVRALARTFFGAQGGRRKIEYDENASFDGTNLATALNGTTTDGALTLRHELTPLTSLSVDVGRVQDRFDSSPFRDANSTIAGVKVTFDPAAIIRGSARFGYRDFKPMSDAIPAYEGTTAAVNLSYVPLGTTKFDVLVSRDVQFSYDNRHPYYLQTGWGASIAQQVYGPVDVVAGFWRYDLDYRNRATATSLGAVADTDTTRLYRLGAGYHVGRDVRVGGTLEKQERHSTEPSRRFNGLRIGASVTYGI